MKKLIAICLVLTMALGFAACGKAPVAEQPAGDVTPLSVLENVWALYGDDEKFALAGSTPEEPMAEAPVLFDLTYAENLASVLQLSMDQMAEVEEAATMIHMMNANIFTGAALKLTEGADVAAFVETVRGNIQSAQWMCGIPERLLIANVDGLVVMAYGQEPMTVFEGHLTEAYAGAEILVSEAIAG